ncbi:hypothetical protein [Bartonella sp. AP58NXGY]|uniref:hypothetical protein n=1 Tax=Bartonella sp. AP58NXGY TaxID=3243498 RepID=UPI0035D07BCB
MPIMNHLKCQGGCLATLGTGKVCVDADLLFYLSVKIMGLKGFTIIAFMDTIAKWSLVS